MKTEELNAVMDFLKHLFSDDTDAYWSTIAKIDQARIYGMYIEDSKKGYFEGVSFYEYVQDLIQPEHAAMYEALRDNHPGKSHNVIDTDEGEVKVRLFENIQMVHIGTMPAKPLEVTLAANIDLVQGVVKASWKVRLYVDNAYRTLNREAPI